MEKYAKLLKGLEVCAGPECGIQCPYHGETRGGKTCRAWLLMDARIAIDNEQALHESAEEYIAHRNEDVERLQADAENREAAYKTIRDERDGLKEYALALEKEGQEARADRDKLKQEITCYIQQRERAEADLHAVREQNKALIEARDALVRKASDMNSQNDELRKECDMLATRCTVLQNEINALVRKMGGKHDGKTDRPSVCDRELMEEVGKLIAQAKYQEGKADALEWFLREWFREGASSHE